MEKLEIIKNNVWFIADLHLLHKNILHHQPQRIEAMGLEGKDDIEGHDQYIVDMWLNTVKRNDHVYVLGDFILSNQQKSIMMLHKLKSKGCHIHLIVGNHDQSTQKLRNMFDSIDMMKVVDFKKTNYPFLDNDICMVMIHYPMKSWPRKPYGSICCHGHTHDNSPWEHSDTELQLNLGLDAKMSQYKLISLEQINDWYKTKLNGLSPREYVDKITKEDPTFIR